QRDESWGAIISVELKSRRPRERGLLWGEMPPRKGHPTLRTRSSSGARPETKKLLLLLLLVVGRGSCHDDDFFRRGRDRGGDHRVRLAVRDDLDVIGQLQVVHVDRVTHRQT